LYFTEKALKNEVDIKSIDLAVYRIAETFIRFGLYEKELPNNFHVNVTTPESIDLSQKGME